MRTPIAVAGSIAQRAGYGGHAWALLQYLLGFRGLGYEPVFVDTLTPKMTSDANGRPSRAVQSRYVRWLEEVMSWAGLERSYALLLEDGSGSVGLSRKETLDRVARSPLLLNVMGFLTDEEVLAAARRRVFLDIDPGFGQMWKELGLADPFRGHDDFVTIAESIGRPGCTIPACGLDWIATPQPIVLDLWPRTRDGSSFTSVGSWRGPYDPVEYRGRRYGLRAHEFRRFVDLPGRAAQPFELALDIDDADAADVERLRRGSWRLVDPRRAAGSLAAYRRYIQGSKAELMVAKGMYVDTRSGWFSERSVCYLASGKPVLAQDTGFASHHPVGEGLLSFADIEEAIAGVNEICAGYDRHAGAARALAEDQFNSRKVLGGLLEKLGVG